MLRIDGASSGNAHSPSSNIICRYFVFIPSPCLALPYPTSPHPPSSTDLVFRSSAHRKLKPHTPSSQLPVNLPISIKSVIHTTLLLLIENDFQHLTPVLLRPDSLSHNLNRIHHIRQDRIMHRCQSTRAGSFLGLGGTATVGSFGTGENAAGSEDEDVAV